MTITDVRRESYDSTLYWAQPADSHDCILMQLKVRVYVGAAPPGTYRFRASLPGATPGQTMLRETELTVGSWQEADLARFRGEFRDAIYRTWNDRLWLRHSGPMTYQHRLGTSRYWNIKCGVSLTFVSDPEDAQMRVLMIFQPSGPKAHHFRDSCSLGGTARPWGPRSWFNIGENPVDMRIRDNLAREDVHRRKPASDSTEPDGMYLFTQNTVGHEFGHYLGLHHTCAAGGATNSSAQYCDAGTIEQQRSLMAVGNDIRPAHAWPWRNRLAAHHYLTDRTWRGRTTPPPRHGG